MALRSITPFSLGAVEHNLHEWQQPQYVAEYAYDALEPVEARLLASHPAELAGRVLELGFGAGRVTGHLLARGGEVHGIDISPAMVAACAQRHPGGHYRQGDMRDLSAYAPASFDAVVAACNILDVLDHADRLATLGEIARVVRPGGVLLMSAHNRYYVPRLHGPAWVLARRPAVALQRVLALPRRIANHRRLAPLQHFEADHAFVNDDAHDFALLQYYVTPQEQVRQLEDRGFAVLQVLDIECRELGPQDHADRHVRIHYAARRQA